MEQSREKVTETTVLRLTDKQGKEIIRFDSDGNIYVKESQCEHAPDIVNAFREILNKTNF